MKTEEKVRQLCNIFGFNVELLRPHKDCPKIEIHFNREVDGLTSFCCRDWKDALTRITEEFGEVA